jgi:hypothetical protein
MISPADDLFLCGWRVRSEIPLPELAPWNGDERAPDLRIRTGTIPTRLDGALDVTPLLQVTPDRQARLSIDGIATYWLKSLHEVVIDPQMPVDSPDVRIFFFGTILGLLCHRRGLFPLHASCIAIDGKAVAISGMSGAGKSTLAAALTRRGHTLLSDDVCVIDPSAGGGPVVLPAFPRVKLWEDSLQAMGLGSTDLPENRPGQRKFHFRFTDAVSFQTEPVPLKAVYLLTASNAPLHEQADIEPLAVMRAITSLHKEIYRRRTADVWGLSPDLFKALGQIVSAVDVYRLIRGPDLADLGAMVQRFEAHAAS